MEPFDSVDGPSSMKAVPSSIARTAPISSSSPQPSFWQCERCFFDENIDEGPISEQICIGCRKIRNALVWSCSECTYHNSIGIKSCEVCGSICYQRDIQTLLNRNSKQARGGLNIHHQVSSKEIMNAYKSKKRKAVALLSQKHISDHALLVPLNEESSPTTAKSSSRKSPRTRDISSRKKETKSSEKKSQGRAEGKGKASVGLLSSVFDEKGLRSDHEEYSEIELSCEEDIVDHEGKELQTKMNRQIKKPNLTRKKESSLLKRSLRSKRGSTGNRQKIDTEYESDESEDEEEEIEINFLKEDDIEEDKDKNKSNIYKSNSNIRQIGGNVEPLNQTSKTTKDKTEAISSMAIDKGKEKKKIMEKDNSNKKTQKRNVKDTTKGQKSEITKSQKLQENHTPHLQELRQSRRTSSSSFSSSSTQPTISVKQKAVINKKPTKQKNQDTKGLTESQIYKGVTATQNFKITSEDKKEGKEDDRANLKGDIKGNVVVSKVSKGKERSSSSQSHPKSNNSKISKADKRSSSNEHGAKLRASVSLTPIRTPSVPLNMFHDLPSLTESSTKNDIVHYHSLIWKHQLSSMHSLIGKVADLKQMSVADFETQYFGSD